jgi:hypothetical protein
VLAAAITVLLPCATLLLLLLCVLLHLAGRLLLCAVLVKRGHAHSWLLLATVLLLLFVL